MAGFDTSVNPFAQSEQYWNVLFSLPASAVGTAEDAFADIALSVAVFETDEANHVWTFELMFGEQPDMAEVNCRLAVIAALHNVTQPEPTVQKLAQEDWLTQVSRSFPPLVVGRFYVHGSHVGAPAPAGTISIQVDAGAAFGSGEHGTTSCCLKALDWLATRRSFANVLDMGTGSGILAIAAAKLWKVPVLAVDIDPISVRVTKENVAVNQVQAYVSAAVSDGYGNPQVKKFAPYDLIVSNILARPLVAFAPSLAASLGTGGIAVLSGLLTSQEKQVMAAHRSQGLSLARRFVQGDWCTLVLER